MLFIIGIVTTLVLCHGVICSGAEVPFDQEYAITFGNDHVKFLNQERSEVQISLNKSYGAGFGSKAKYASGLFQMNIKLPPGDSAGVVTTFYLHSGGIDNHDEVDMEFLGNREGKPIILQTNVFANGYGEKEQRMALWFDPSADYHTYKVLWNPHQIVIFIDETPVRVFKNNTALGVGFPTQPMQVLASVWNGDDWATDGGRTKIIWAHAPFNVEYKGFRIDGCAANASTAVANATTTAANVSTAFNCTLPELWWNQQGFWNLTEEQEQRYQDARKSLTYDYCFDTKRNPVPPVECRNSTTASSSSIRRSGPINKVYFLLLIMVIKSIAF